MKDKIKITEKIMFQHILRILQIKFEGVKLLMISNVYRDVFMS